MDHQHEHDHEEGVGMALGFRIFEEAGALYYVEAEITPYVDEPNALGATLVFHPLEEMDPTATDDDIEWPAWPIDIDDDLSRDAEAPMKTQFQAIVRELSNLSDGRLREYLQQAREDATEEEA